VPCRPEPYRKRLVDGGDIAPAIITLVKPGPWPAWWPTDQWGKGRNALWLHGWFA